MNSKYCLCKLIAQKKCCTQFVENDNLCCLPGEITNCPFAVESFIQRHNCGEKKVKLCLDIYFAKINGCKHFEAISEQCLLKNGYYGCISRYCNTHNHKSAQVKTHFRNGKIVQSYIRSVKKY